LTSEETARQAYPPSALLCDECDAIDTGRRTSRSFLPDIIGERLLSSERGSKRRGRVGKGLKAERTQPMPLIGPNTPNAHAHGTQFARDSDLPTHHAQRARGLREKKAGAALFADDDVVVDSATMMRVISMSACDGVECSDGCA
jgi:hypothetical protein